MNAFVLSNMVGIISIAQARTISCPAYAILDFTCFTLMFSHMNSKVVLDVATLILYLVPLSVGEMV